MPTGFDHLLALILAVFFPIRAATFGYRRLERALDSDVVEVRRSLYLQALLIQWGLVAVLGALWIVHARTARELGLVMSWSPAFLGMMFLVAIAIVLLAIQVRRGANDPEVHQAVMRRLGHFERMLPHTPGELRMFWALSLTAGVCEELLYRGFLMWYLSHWLGIVPTLLLVSVLFGLGHSYQGVRGILTTGIVAVVLGLVYVVAGSLVPAMLLHAAGDLHSGTLAYAALSRRPLAPPPDQQASSPDPHAESSRDPMS